MKAFKINVTTIGAAVIASVLMAFVYVYQNISLFSGMEIGDLVTYVMDMNNWPIWYQIGGTLCGYVIEFGFVALPVTLLIGIIVKVVKWINK